MRMTYASFMHFIMKMLTWACYEVLSPWRNERGATATTTKMVPRQHSDDLITHWDTGGKEQVCGCAKHAEDGGVLPDSGFPRYGGMAIEERAKTSLGHGANTSISYNKAFAPRTSSRVIPSKHAFWNGSSSLREVVEVVVHKSERK